MNFVARVLEVDDAVLQTIADTVGLASVGVMMVTMLSSPELTRWQRVGLVALPTGFIAMYKWNFSVSWILAAIGALVASEVWRRVILRWGGAHSPETF